MITVKKGDITKERCDAIVNPANSYGTMGGGVALAIKKSGGDIIEQQAMDKAPIKVGEAVITISGKLPCRFVIHAPTMEKPAEKIPPENVRKAMRAALECARAHKLKSIAIPGMGTGVGGVRYGDAAMIMVEEARKCSIDVVFVAYGQELYRALESELK
ncbi:MAG: macro domain-containing protein [Candidatus Aenigmarchaeota archaeon]|nr:macro domain-containing protein [Candidatus Aenigmarchaeota archaeon]